MQRLMVQALEPLVMLELMACELELEWTAKVKVMEMEMVLMGLVVVEEGEVGAEG